VKNVRPTGTASHQAHDGFTPERRTRRTLNMNEWRIEAPQRRADPQPAADSGCQLGPVSSIAVRDDIAALESIEQAGLEIAADDGADAAFALRIRPDHQDGS